MVSCNYFSRATINTANSCSNILAAPQVSAALAVLLTRHPEWKDPVGGMEQAKNRLLKSAKKLPGTDLGEGQIDDFEAVFNGNFELVKVDSNQPEEI